MFFEELTFGWGERIYSCNPRIQFMFLFVLKKKKKGTLTLSYLLPSLFTWSLHDTCFQPQAQVLGPPGEDGTRSIAHSPTKTGHLSPWTDSPRAQALDQQS